MTLVFNRDFEPRHGEPVEIRPGVRRVTAANEGPFTFRGTNTFLIGTKNLAVLDPGPADAAHVDALMRAIGGAEVSHILLTHTHRDHSDAAALVKQRTGAPVVSGGKNRVERPPPSGEDVRLDAGTDHGFAADRMLADGDFVDVGRYRLEAVATPGHAANHLAFALVGTETLFSGDHVMGWSTTVVAPPDGSMADYMRSLDRLLARPEKLYLPAHGGPIAHGPDHVRALKAHRVMRENAIVDNLRAGAGSVPELVARVYAGLDPRLAGGAALSTLAHLEDLVVRGIVASDGPPALDRRYWLATPVASAPGSG